MGPRRGCPLPVLHLRGAARRHLGGGDRPAAGPVRGASRLPVTLGLWIDRLRAGAHTETARLWGCANAERGPPTIFLSCSGDESLEADLLQFAIERLLQDVRARVWTYERDQRRDESDKAKVRSILTQLQKHAPSRHNIANVQSQVSTKLDLRSGQPRQRYAASSDAAVNLARIRYENDESLASSQNPCWTL